MRGFCLGHRAPLFAPGLEFTMVCPVALGVPGEIVIPDDAYPHGGDGALSEYTQFFGLAERLAAGDIVADFLYLFQYRKFLSRVEGRRRSTNMPYAFVANAGEAAGLAPTLDELSALPERRMVGPTFRCEGSMSRQYAEYHVLEDLVGLVAACATLGTPARDRLCAFVNDELILPSPTLCYIDAALLCALAAPLAAVWKEFAQRFYVQRDGYQRRVGGFLLERLHGFLLREHLAASGELEAATSHLVIVSDTLEVVPTGF